jgi:hypothetical protein
MRSRSAAVIAPGNGPCIGLTSGSGWERTGAGISGMAYVFECDLRDGAAEKLQLKQKSRNFANHIDATQIKRNSLIQARFYDVGGISTNALLATKMVLRHHYCWRSLSSNPVPPSTLVGAGLPLLGGDSTCGIGLFMRPGMAAMIYVNVSPLTLYLLSDCGSVRLVGSCWSNIRVDGR